MIFYVPINLDLKQLIFKHLILSKELKVTEGKIAFICHSLFSSIIMHRSEIEDSDNPYVPLCSKILDLAVRFSFFWKLVLLNQITLISREINARDIVLKTHTVIENLKKSI